MTDWATIANMATAGGTLVLAAATFASIRSADRAARSAERSLLQGLRPVLVPSRFEDRTEKIVWIDEHHVRLPGGHGYAALVDDAIYLAISVRNVGAGLAVLQAWDPLPRRKNAAEPHAPAETFRLHTRDLYIAPGDVGYWQGALRDDGEEIHKEIYDAIKQRHAFGLDLLYSDHEGGQRTITRFSVAPRGDGDWWFPTVSRHWNLDRPDPR